MDSSRWSINGFWFEGVVESVVGDGEESSSSLDVGHVFGTATPAVRKKRRGEAKESNADPGELKSLSFKQCNFLESHISSSTSD